MDYEGDDSEGMVSIYRSLLKVVIGSGKERWGRGS